ncbi:MAG: protease-like activity factor CPAF [Gammaproteobacteria bacterium]|nr:protease-like activity factor CPAF [Gammaproteobacteria bacterium]
MSKLGAVCLGIIGWGVLSLSQSASLQKEMLRELDRIHNAFYTLYAPRHWKKEFANWDLETQISQAKEKVLSHPDMTVKEYHRVLNEFLTSTQDFHVGMALHSTEGATLPFQVKGIGGQYFLVYIDRIKLPVSDFPFQVGDELISFGEEPVFDVITRLQKEMMGNIRLTPTHQELIEKFLTRRTGKLGMNIPKGSITIGVRPKGKQKNYTRQLRWDYSPEGIRYTGLETAQLPSPFSPMLALAPGSEANPLQKILDISLTAAPWVKGLGRFPAVGNPYSVGEKKSFVPDLGKKVWETSPLSSFYAYLFELPNQKVIGYVRIPHFMGNALAVFEFSQIIKHFESKADALVVDEMNNPGGSLFYMYALASMLSDQALVTPRHRMSITPSDVKGAYQALEILEQVEGTGQAKAVLGLNLNGYPMTYEFANFMRGYYEFIIAQWEAGKRLTEPYYIAGIDHIAPYPEAQFTKPILLLVNSLVFSGGDFFAAILQDNERATLLGSRTAGAGGFVVTEQASNLFGIEDIAITASIAERKNKKPIENLGVNPDIAYSFTVDDLRENYTGYVSAIHAGLGKLLQ